MENPFSGKWILLCWRANSNIGPDKFFGLVKHHDPTIQCEDPNECWQLEDHETTKMWNSLEELKKTFNLTNNSEYANYIPIQIP